MVEMAVQDIGVVEVVVLEVQEVLLVHLEQELFKVDRQARVRVGEVEGTEVQAEVQITEHPLHLRQAGEAAAAAEAVGLEDQTEVLVHKDLPDVVEVEVPEIRTVGQMVEMDMWL